jgi:hypothetical protein
VNACIQREPGRPTAYTPPAQKPCSSVSWGELELVSLTCLGHANRARRELKNGVCGKTCRYPPRRHIAFGLSYPQTAVQVNQVYGEAHAEGVYGFTGQNPKPLSGRESIAPQEAFCALCTTVGNFHPKGDFRLAGEVRNPKPDIRLRLPTKDMAKWHKPSQSLSRG